MQSQASLDQPASIHDLLSTIAKWHRTEVSLDDPIPVLAKQVREIRDFIMQKMMARQGEIDTFTKKVGAIEEELMDQLNQAQAHMAQIDKTVASTEQECARRLQRLEKERLQRKIQRKTAVDQRILDMLSRDHQSQENSNQSEEFQGRISKIRNQVTETEKRWSQKLNSYRKTIEECYHKQKMSVDQQNRDNDWMLRRAKKDLEQLVVSQSKKIEQIRKRRDSKVGKILEQIEKEIQVIYDGRDA